MPLDDNFVRKRLEVLLRDEALVDTYLRIYGPRLDMKNVQAVKEKAQASIQGDKAGTGEEPVYSIAVKCPVCLQSGLACHELKSKSLLITNDLFLVPRYEGVKGFRTIDYSFYAVTVCPACLFASPDKKDFITAQIQTRSENRSQLSQYVLKELKENEAKRRGILGAVEKTDAFFRVPRKLEAAVSSYRLAVARAMVEAELETPGAWYKAGMYCLKIARMLRDAGKPDDEVLKESLGHLIKSYQSSELKNPGLEFQLLYLIVAVALRLGAMETCESYLGVQQKSLRDLKEAAKEYPEGQTALPEKWTAATMDLWGRREDADLWQH